MSKPNLLGFASSVGIYRNKRVRDLHHLLIKSVHRKVDFADMAPMLFQTVMAYAAENQIDGDFSSYNARDWADIWAVNHVQVSTSEASIILKGFEQVGLFQDGKIRSWAKFNRHLADYEGLVKAKRKAAKVMHKKRENEARAALQNGTEAHPKIDPNPEKNGVKNDSPSKQLWLIEKALENAKGPARKELLTQKRQLLSNSTGVDLSHQPEPPQPASKPHKPSSPAESRRASVKAARAFLEEGNYDLLTDKMVQDLVDAGEQLPESVRSRFRKLLEQLEKETGHNPVPG